MPTLTNSQLSINAQLDNWVYTPTASGPPSGTRLLTSFSDPKTDVFAALVGQTNAAGVITGISLVFRGTQFSGALSHPGATLQDLLDDLQIAQGQSSNKALVAAQSIADQAAQWVAANGALTGGHTQIDQTIGQSLGGVLALAAGLELHSPTEHPTWNTTTNTEAALNGDAALATIFSQSQLQAASSYSTNEVFGADHVTGPYSWFGGSTLEQQVILPPNGTWVENTIIRSCGRF